MIEVSRQVAALPPTPVQVQGVPIVPVDVRVPIPAATGASPCSRLFCNASLNSRLPAKAPEKVEVRWSAPFIEAFDATTVLQDGDRVLAYGGGVWRLYNLGGEPLKDGRNGPSAVVLDGENGLFYFINSNGFLAAHRLADGGEEFVLFVAAGDAWPFLARRGRRFLDVAMEMPKPFRPVPPNHVTLEHLDLPEKLELTRIRAVSNVDAGASLHLKTSTVSAALWKDQLVFAAPGRVFTASMDLQVKAAFDGEFVPRFLSVDELGRIHLIVRVGEQNALWVLTPSGQRTGAYTLKPEQGNALTPPVIGYDHTIYLVASGLAAFDAYGDLLWERWPRGRFGGAGATTDGKLLVTAGDLSVYDAKGGQTILSSAPLVSLVSPPAMSAAGEIFAASKNMVFCFTPK